MDRTYNAFVDNGLYVASYYLNKPIEDIILEDLKDSIDMFANTTFSFISCEKYSQLANMAFTNSAYAQPSFKNNRLIKIKEQFDNFLNNVGEEEYCSICGKKHIKSVANSNKDFIKSLSRCVFPTMTANTFINYANNLQLVNICPVCIFLTLISILNMRKTGNTVTIYNSDDNEFMEDYTYRLQEENASAILQKATLETTNISNTQHISDEIAFLINQRKIYDGYIQSVSFYNGQTQSYSENFIDKNKISFIKKLQEMNLFGEFKQHGLMKLLIKNSLNKLYIGYLVDNKEYKLKCSEDLFNEVDKEVWRMDLTMLQLIKDVCSKLHRIQQKDEIKSLKECSSINQFEQLILTWMENYKKETNEDLITIDEFNKLCDIKKLNSIKNRMICGLM